MNKSESIAEISKAMAEFQKEVKQPLKDADNPFFKSKYVPLESVVEAIMDVAPKHGLSFTQWPLNSESGQVGVATILMHTSGEFIEFDPVFMQADKQTAQGYGALITYIKRYTLSAIFGITSDQDDDGNGASGNNGRQKGNRQTEQQPNPITSNQIGMLKDKALEFAKLRGRTDKEVFEAMKIQDITKLSSSQASAAIKKVTEWIEEAKKNVVSETQSQETST